MKNWTSCEQYVICFRSKKYTHHSHSNFHILSKTHTHANMWHTYKCMQTQWRWVYIFQKQLKVKVTQSCLTLCDPMNYTVHGILQARILEWVAISFSKSLFPTQGSNPGLPHCRQILYHLSHQGSTRILEWVAYPFSRESSWHRNWTGVSCIAGLFFTSWAIG